MKKLFLFLLFAPLLSFGQTNEANELLGSGIQKVFDDKFDEALIDFNLALEKEQKDNLIHRIFFERAQLKRRYLKDFNGALKDYNSSIRFNPNYLRAYVYRGILYERNFRDYKAAEKDYRKSIEIDPECGTCWMQLGYSYRTVSTAEQIESLEIALDLGTDLDFNGQLEPTFYIYNRIADIKLEFLGDYIGAIESYQRLIDNYEELDSDGDGEVDDLGYLDEAHASISGIYFKNLNEMELALDFINKAIDINPNDKDYFTLRAKIRYKIGDIETALQDYSTAKKTVTKTYFNTVYDPSSFYPYQELDRNLDSIELPITVNTKIDVYDILGLDTTNDQFFMALNYNVYSKLDSIFINYRKKSFFICLLIKFFFKFDCVNLITFF